MKEQLKDISILLVDDEADLLTMTKARLELDGAQVQEASNGEEAFELFQKNQYDIVITDIRMPKMDGCQLTQKIRETDLKTPIICMSGFSDYDNTEILKLGATESFCKPLPISDLIDKIMHHTQASA